MAEEHPGGLDSVLSLPPFQLRVGASDTGEPQFPIMLNGVIAGLW